MIPLEPFFQRKMASIALSQADLSNVSLRKRSVMLLNILYYNIPATVIDLAYPNCQKGQHCQNRLKKARLVDALPDRGLVGSARQAFGLAACVGHHGTNESGARNPVERSCEWKSYRK